MKGEGVENITAVQALVKRLSEAKDFQEALAVQTAFILSQLNVFAKKGGEYQRGIYERGTRRSEEDLKAACLNITVERCRMT
jgi:hypothetical protein